MKLNIETESALCWFHGVMVSTQDSESCDPSSSLGGTSSTFSSKQIQLILFCQAFLKAPAVGKVCTNIQVPCGLVVRISGFHPGGRGSIPRTGEDPFIESTSPFQQSHNAQQLMRDPACIMQTRIETPICLTNARDNLRIGFSKMGVVLYTKPL